MSKTVYVLGSGFSVCGGAPTQNSILEILFAMPLLPSLNPERGILSGFLENIFGLDVRSQNALKNFELENAFTVLDKCLINREPLGGYSLEDLVMYRAALSKCINTVMYTILSEHTATFYRNLADAILGKRIEAGQESDPFAFITLNWDIILDNAIYRAYDEANKKSDNAKCRIDYCCYTTPYEMDDHQHNSIEVKRMGYYNIKIQKLHGSMNWLNCVNCGILYYKMEDKIARWEGNPKKSCPFCENELRSVLLQPTFLKDLNNTHLKMVWHNALIDLMEADRVVFVGYSLPLADFELRYLLKRGIRSNTKIEVVLVDEDKKNGTQERYKSFFGSQIHANDFFFNGSCSFLAREFDFIYSKEDCVRF